MELQNSFQSTVTVVTVIAVTFICLTSNSLASYFFHLSIDPYRCQNYQRR